MPDRTLRTPLRITLRAPLRPALDAPLRGLRRAAMASSALLLAPLPASATIVDWGATAGWSVAVDTTFSPRSCFAAAEFGNGTYFRLGVDPSDATLYVVLANSGWASLEEGETYYLQMNFGDETPWGFDMHAGAFPDGEVFLISFTDDWRLLDEFAGQPVLSVAYAGSEIAMLDLSGSREALGAVLECQRAMDQDVAPARVDPFALRPDEPGDRFAP